MPDDGAPDDARPADAGRSSAWLRSSRSMARPPHSTTRSPPRMAAGATADEIVDAVVAVGSTVGSAHLVSAAPKVALALGYDVSADLESDPARAPAVTS